MIMTSELLLNKTF